MREQEIRGIMEAYAQVYSGPEQLDEVNYDVESEKEAIKRRDAALGWVGNQARRLANATVDSFKDSDHPTKGKDTFTSSPTKPAKPPTEKQGPPVPKRLQTQPASAPTRQPAGSGSSSSPRPAATAAAKPAASGPVLSKKDGVEGTGVGANFKPRAFTDAEKSRYASVAAKPATPATTEKDPMKIWAAAHPDLAAKVKPGQSGYNSIQQQRNAASLSAPVAPASSTLGKTVTAATAKPLGTNFNSSPTAAPKPAATPAIRPGGLGMSSAGLNAKSSVTTGTTGAPVKPAAPAATPAPAPAAAPTPKPSTPGAGRDFLMKQQLKQDLDIFDIVKGHLLDEGYAETEEAAIVMMANMSEEWRNSVLESYGINIQETKGDGNLANNYPPYDTVTRGDVIAGALGKDQMGGKKKKKKD